MRRIDYLIAAGAFLLAFALRVSNAPVAFAGDVPRIGVLDDLYHLKRMTRMVDFDPDRGERGAFCPWPPLYDFSAGAAARLLGASGPGEVLRRVVWIPPLVAALFAAAAAFVVTRRIGWEAGAAMAIALAASPLLIAESSIGNIDHHFLEAPLVFAILAARRRPYLLALALLAAMFVQTALVVAAGLAFFAVFFMSDRRDGAIAFGIAAAVIALYRLTQPDGYPNSEWFLGWTHVALFAAAAVADGLKTVLHRAWALALGGLIGLAALPQMVQGMRFLGGDPWLRTIVEFQPVWRAHGDELVSLLLGLGAGAILVWPLIGARTSSPQPADLRSAGPFAEHSRRIGDPATADQRSARQIALFAIPYLLLTLTSRRFCLVAIPLLALAGVVYARQRRVVLLAVVAPVLVQLVMWQRAPFGPPVDERQQPWIRAAAFLGAQTPGGRVLAPWSMGHAIDVIGGRAVIMDNFGTMADPGAFARAHDAFLAVDEEAVWRYCRAANIRFIVLDNPLYGLQGAAADVGLDPPKFAARTWWWRAYYGRAARRFHLVYVDPQPSWRGTPMFRGPALEIWERSL